MARGDVILFDQFYTDEGRGVHDLDANTLMIGLVTDAVTPLRTTPDPRWGAGGTTNFAAQEVAAGGNYVAGGTDLQATFSKDNGTSTLRFVNVSWQQNAANPQDASWGIFYNTTATGNQCVGFVDLGGILDMRAGPLTINWHANGVAIKGASAGPV